jgi:predicted dithiol-disulfide oxidoreductase (DUF899 family)
MEAVAAELRALPPGGAVPKDYEFDHIDAKGAPAKVRLSELFRPGTDTLLMYHYMFPRHRSDVRPRPSGGPTAQLPLEEGPCPSCTALLDNWEGASRVGHVSRRRNPPSWCIGVSGLRLRHPPYVLSRIPPTTTVGPRDHLK